MLAWMHVFTLILELTKRGTKLYDFRTHSLRGVSCQKLALLIWCTSTALTTSPDPRINVCLMANTCTRKPNNSVVMSSPNKQKIRTARLSAKQYYGSCRACCLLCFADTQIILPEGVIGHNSPLRVSFLGIDKPHVVFVPQPIVISSSCHFFSALTCLLASKRSVFALLLFRCVKVTVSGGQECLFWLQRLWPSSGGLFASAPFLELQRRAAATAVVSAGPRRGARPRGQPATRRRAAVPSR